MATLLPLTVVLVAAAGVTGLLAWLWGAGRRRGLVPAGLGFWPFYAWTVLSIVAGAALSVGLCLVSGHGWR